MFNTVSRGAPHTWRVLSSMLVLAAALGFPADAAAQWSRVFDQFYFPDQSAWAFRRHYPGADRLFNAFDYGHAILYEKLYTKPGADPSILEEKEYNFLTRKVLVHPPRVPLEEAAIEVAYAKLAPEAKAMFEWAHVLHRQIYDIWGDERIPVSEKDARVAKLLTYYKSRRDLAYSSKPKNMELMEGQYYSLAFRQRYPKFNGLIWGYHWLQIGLYEPLLAGKNLDERQTGVLAAVAQFRHMIENPPTWMPRTMPMTPAVAPLFTARYPEAAAIFDNLHSMHDVISDILASEKVPRNQKRAEILKAASRFRDDTSFVMTVAEWQEMSTMMGVQNMGGPVTGLLAAFPTPTMERGAPAHEAMKGMDTGHAAHQRRDSVPVPRTDPTAAHQGHTTTDATMSADSMRVLHERMMADPVIRRRIMADTALRRMMDAMMPGAIDSATAHEGHTEMATPAARPPARRTTSTKATGTKTTSTKTTSTKTKAPAAKKPPAPAKTEPVDHSKHTKPPAKKP